ncbi:leucyl aminopeptidase [Poseidonocella sedimentorum]|uniref:Probable cytosol aminopeptidase n=1 Tax=Poseidonocella sedimentorum TaxID=871652 RepID=A0A1I6DZ21_9RHOB|nr:leucyl aminopeptidase [Poseidonocella sedimentorum]SFR10780.1 leucyl aminopeptidase [Poseidonocella sedimentorum]
MTDLLSFSFEETTLEGVAEAEGRIAVFVEAPGKLDTVGRRVNRLTKGAVLRLSESARFEKAAPGDVITLAWPSGMAAEAVDVVKLERRAPQDVARKAGANLAKAKGASPLRLALGTVQRGADVVLGLAARAYEFRAHKTADAEAQGGVTVMASRHEELEAASATSLALAEAMFFTRDLVNEPANVLTTTEFAERLVAMKELGLEVEVLEEADMEKLGMGSLLSVGHGSASPSKMVVMKWMGGEAGAAPLALVGKGVVFDTGGISLKPAAGMEDMTMDMGGAGVVSGVMRALALRKARANVIGLVGLVENMPSDRATRPGDVVTSMKGDTIEVINTDAEGRLVLCDVLWYAQETFQPDAIVDLATLTGAIIIGLGHDNAGVFSNDDGFAGRFLKAAQSEGEGAWRLPLGKCYDDLLKSRIADMKNVGGRAAGSITAAQFLQRFIKDGTPWIHLDIAGVASVKTDTALAPKGATGWGVLALNRLVADHYES